MTELLKRWAVLEPERCDYQENEIFALYTKGSTWCVAAENIEHADHSMIQGTVQEAMVRHRMIGGVKYEKLPNGFYTWIARVEWNGVGCNTGDDFPAYALLFCYLDRLEAKLKKSKALEAKS